jgi:hypothetical protein
MSSAFQSISRNFVEPSGDIIGPMRLKISRKYVAVSVVLIVIIVISALLLLAPRPSVAAYCKLYKDENSVLAHKNSPKDLASAYAKLEQVAPNDIKSDTTTLRKIYQRIDSDPSPSIAASLSGLSAEANIENWVKRKCTQ